MIIKGSNLNKPHNSVITYILCYGQYIMKGLVRQFENSNYNLRKAIGKTKDEKLKKELLKRLDNNRQNMGDLYYP